MFNFCPLHSEKCNPYKVYDSIESVKDVWKQILPIGHHLNVEHLQLFENSNPEFVTFKYLIVENSLGNPIGLAYLQFLNFNSNHYNNEVLNKPKLDHIKSYILKQNTNLLICGNLFRINFQGFYFQDINNNHLILPVLKHFAKKNPYKINFTGLLLKDCIDQLPESDLKCNRYKSFSNDMSMNLKLRDTWTTFDDYKADLSRKYLQRANKIRKAKEKLNLKEFTLEDTIQNSKLLEQLYLNIASRQSIKMGLLNAQYFIEMKKALNENFKLVGYYLENKLVAFSSYIFENNNLEVHYIGIDYMYNESHKLYFNIIYDGLEIAIDKKLDSVELGRTAMEAKASVGAMPVAVNNYVWVKLGLPTIVYNFFYKWFKSNESDEWKNRNPFKN